MKRYYPYIPYALVILALIGGIYYEQTKPAIKLDAFPEPRSAVVRFFSGSSSSPSSISYYRSGAWSETSPGSLNPSVTVNGQRYHVDKSGVFMTVASSSQAGPTLAGKGFTLTDAVEQLDKSGGNDKYSLGTGTYNNKPVDELIYSDTPDERILDIYDRATHWLIVETVEERSAGVWQFAGKTEVDYSAPVPASMFNVAIPNSMPVVRFYDNPRDMFNEPLAVFRIKSATVTIRAVQH